ncbi:MAG: porin [Rhodobacter sp.]|nr:porin [Rhodobacter sp.]
MKRVLLATTALCMSAGTAVADVALSGAAEMGVAASKDNSVRFHTDVDVKFTLSGETDGGVTFGSAVELNDIENAAGRQTTNDDDDDGSVAVFIEDADGFGKLTLGDTPGAIAWAVSDARGAGANSLRDDHELGGDGNDGLDDSHDNQILLWNRAIGSGFEMAASVELDDHADNEASEDPILGVGGKYSMAMGVGTLGLGLGFQMGSDTISVADDNEGATAPLWNDEVDLTAVGGSVSIDFGNGGDGIKVIADAGVAEGDGSISNNSGVVTDTLDYERMHFGLGVGYTVGAIKLGVNVGSRTSEWTDSNPRTDNDSVTIEETVSGIGFSAAYSLGGGAELQLGVGSKETEVDRMYGSARTVVIPSNAAEGTTRANVHDSSVDTNRWSLGVKFAF